MRQRYREGREEGDREVRQKEEEEGRKELAGATHLLFGQAATTEDCVQSKGEKGRKREIRCVSFGTETVGSQKVIDCDKSHSGIFTLELFPIPFA